MNDQFKLLAFLLEPKRTQATMGEWEELLGTDFELIKGMLVRTGDLAKSYPCPTPGYPECPRRVECFDDAILGICDNEEPQCDTLKLSRAEVALHRLDLAGLRSRVAVAIRTANCLEETQQSPSQGVLPVGVWIRGSERYECILTSAGSADVATRVSAMEDRVVAIALGSDEMTSVCIGGKVVVYLPVIATPWRSLGLARALPLISPEHHRRALESDSGVFEDVEIEFREVPGKRHVVIVNGQDLDAFGKSDLKFLQLLYLATARRVAGRSEGSGYLVPTELEMDESGRNLSELRKILTTATAPIVGKVVAEKLIRTSKAQSNRIRLAVDPANIVVDSSCGRLRSLSTSKLYRESKKAEQWKKHRAKTAALLRRVRKSGVLSGYDPISEA